MLDIKSTRLGDFDFRTRSLEEDEKKFYGVFISHSSADNENYLYPLRDAMRERCLYPLCDRDFLSGGDEFQMKIESTLNCYAAVVIVTEASLRSTWVNYEIGILSSRKIPVYLWDPEGLFAKENRGKSELIDSYLDSHISRYLPAYRTMESLLDALAIASPYSGMFTEENSFIDYSAFCRRVNERVETVIATIESGIFDDYYADFKDCKFGILVTNFGMFYPDHADGEHCYAKRGMPTGGVCPMSGAPCALVTVDTVDEQNKECVILNHVSYTGTLLRQGELNRAGVPVERGCLEYHVPLHTVYGTEFKFIVDVADNSRYNSIMSIFAKAGMNPTSSESQIGGRIYLSLPERRAQGLFMLKHEFSNNFLCPHAARKH